MKSSDSQSAIADAFLHLASEIARDTNATEAELRTAISRAYYAVLLTARDRLFGPDGIALNRARNKLQKRFGKKRRSLGSHETIILAISDIPRTSTINPTALQSQIGQLREARTHADYLFDANTLKAVSAKNWQDYCQNSLALAALLLPVVRRLPPYP